MLKRSCFIITKFFDHLWSILIAKKEERKILNNERNKYICKSTNLHVFAMRVRVSLIVSKRLIRCAVLAGRPRTPRAPASVNRIGKYRTLANLLMPMICQVILFRCLLALHEIFVPSAIRFLSVQARLTAPVTVTLNGRYAKQRKALRCGLAKHLAQIIFAIYDSVHNLLLNDVSIAAWFTFRWYYRFILTFDGLMLNLRGWQNFPTAIGVVVLP